MANPVVETAYEATELEAWATETLPDLVQNFDSFYSFAKKRFKKVAISNVTSAGGITRPSLRSPFRVQGGAGISQMVADTPGNVAALGRGTGSYTDAFAVSPVTFTSVCEISWLTQQATKGKERGVVNVQKKELEMSLEAMTHALDGVMNGDGSGAIDQIPAGAVITTGGSGATTSSIQVNVAAAFTDQQVVSIFPSVGGATRGQATISFVDPVANILYFSTALPATGGATQVGDFIMVAGAAGTTGSSVLGLRAWDVNSNAGTIAGINRALYPGRLSTPTINLGGTGAVTPSLAQRVEVILARAVGDNAESSKSGVYYTNYAQGLSFANLWYGPRITQNMEKGESVPDAARKYLPTSFGGREIVYSNTASTTRLELILPDNWVMGEMTEIQLHDFGGGNTVTAVPTNSGATTFYMSNMFAYETSFNLVNTAPLHGLFVQGIPVPTI